MNVLIDIVTEIDPFQVLRFIRKCVDYAIMIALAVLLGFCVYALWQWQGFKAFAVGVPLAGFALGFLMSRDMTNDVWPVDKFLFLLFQGFVLAAFIVKGPEFIIATLFIGFVLVGIKVNRIRTDYDHPAIVHPVNVVWYLSVLYLMKNIALDVIVTAGILAIIGIILGVVLSLMPLFNTKNDLRIADTFAFVAWIVLLFRASSEFNYPMMLVLSLGGFTFSIISSWMSVNWNALKTSQDYLEEPCLL